MSSMTNAVTQAAQRTPRPCPACPIATPSPSSASAPSDTSLAIKGGHPRSQFSHSLTPLSSLILPKHFPRPCEAWSHRTIAGAAAEHRTRRRRTTTSPGLPLHTKLARLLLLTVLKPCPAKIKLPFAGISPEDAAVRRPSGRRTRASPDAPRLLLAFPSRPESFAPITIAGDPPESPRRTPLQLGFRRGRRR